MKNRFLIYLFAIVLFTSCHTSKEILYFQDIAVNQPEAIVGARDITVQPKDQISIMVSSKTRSWQRCSTWHVSSIGQELPIYVVATIMVKYPVTRSMTRET